MVQEKKQATDFARDAALYLDFYGGLLTGKQAEILSYYYNEDYSLSEIAKGLGISRQAAHDAIRSGTQALSDYEDKLGLINNYKHELKTAGEIREAVAELRTAIAKVRETAACASAGRPMPDQHIDKIDKLEAVALRIERKFSDMNA